eukprot:scaffold37330_cov64-Phaeocystis_antarctica.AAC.3
MHTIGERHVQITKAIEEKSKRGSVYNRRFLGGDCRCQPSLNSPEADPIGPTCRAPPQPRFAAPPPQSTAKPLATDGPPRPAIPPLSTPPLATDPAHAACCDPRGSAFFLSYTRKKLHSRCLSGHLARVPQQRSDYSADRFTCTCTCACACTCACYMCMCMYRCLPSPRPSRRARRRRIAAAPPVQHAEPWPPAPLPATRRAMPSVRVRVRARVSLRLYQRRGEQCLALG